MLTRSVVKLWDIRLPGTTTSQRPKASPVGQLPDPTVCGLNPSRRPRSVNALCEDARTGDLYALCGDSQIHVLRPSAVHTESISEAILPYKYAHPDLLTRSFYIRMSLSSDGRYLACGSSHAGVMTWDTSHAKGTPSSILASRLPIPSESNPEVIAVDWGRDMVRDDFACASLTISYRHHAMMASPAFGDCRKGSPVDTLIVWR